MDKETFLRLQYLRMINSEQFVVEQWRSSIDRFIADMWDRTPAQGAKSRFLEPIDATLGFSPDNVEWQFPKVKPRRAATKKTQPPKTVVQEIVPRPTKAERKANASALAAAQREAKRQAIADELAAWNNGQLVRRG